MDAEPIKKQLHRYYDMIAGGVCLVRQSAEEQILFVNKEMLKLYQCKTEQEFYQLTKGRFAGLMEADDYMPLEARMNSRHGEAAEGYAFLAFRCYTKEGVYLHVEGTFQNGTVPGFGKVWMLNLVNKERSMAVSDLDPVTGLLNMHAFYQRVEKKIDAQRAKRQPDDTGMLYCPVYLNLTNFKVYNETHGLYEGDRMLRKIGQMLKSKFPSSYITRLSGDNFALFVPRQGLEIKIRDFCQAVNNEIHLPNITMKAGIGSFDEEAGTRRRAITAYFDQAKLACDSIKKDATRFAAFYHDSMRRSMADRIFILDNLDKAIEQGHIQVYYQPVIRTMTGKLCGCEKIQGYYYGRPMPYELLREHCKKKGWLLETLSEEQACDAAGLVNLITDAPVAIFQYRKDDAQIISANDAYQKVLATSGTSSREEFNENMRTASYPMREKFMTLLAGAAHSVREEHMTFVENGQYLRLNAQKIAATPDFTLMLARLANITYDQDLTAFHQYENVFRNLMLVYDGIYFIDRQRKALYVIESMTSLWQAGDVVDDLKKMADTYAQHYIHPEDRARFRRFLDPAVIYQQAERSGRSEAIEMFRVKRPDGRFVWMIFDAIVIYKSTAKDILICVRENIWERQENLHALLPKFLPYLQSSEHSSLHEAAMLWQAACNFSPIPFYWKDNEQRYRGVNPAFLDYFGLADAEAILGKTDAELGWCLQDEEEEQAEKEILHKGKTCRDYRTFVLVHGIPQRISLSAFPVYQGGKITGLLGSINVRDTATEKRERESLGILDRDTGFLGFRGMTMAGMRLEDDRVRRGEDYLATILQVPEIKALVHQYSRETQQQILSEICTAIRGHAPKSAIFCYIGSGVFCIFSKAKYTDALTERLNALKSTVESITSVAGYSCTLTLTATTIRGSEAKGFNTLLYLLAKRLNDAICQRWPFERPSGDSIQISMAQLKEAEDGISLIDIDTYDILYFNPALLHMLKLPVSPDSYRGRKCYELLAGRAAPCTDCINHTLQRYHLHTWKRSAYFTSGTILQRDMLVPWKGKNARFSIMTNLQHYQKDLESEKNTLLRREEVINDIITIGIQEPDPEEGIRKMMARIGETLQAERFLIFEESGHGTVSSTYEWRRDTAESVMKDTQEMPLSRLQALYDHFEHSHVLIIHDVDQFLQLHPGFHPVLQGLTSLISGHLTQSGRSIGFTEVVNPASESFSSATFLLSSLTSVLAIMLRNRDMIRRLETYSYRDQLTGVGNRRALLSFIRTIPDGTSLAFFFGDINGLKVENYTKGHEAGDLLIKKAATVLVAAAGPERVFRMGGDEFLLVVENITKQEADAMLKELRATYARQHVSVAIGCTVQVSPLRSIDTILSEADALMYENKRQMHAHHKES